MSKGFADIQRGLNDLGYGPLIADGIPGPKSLAALLRCHQMGGAPNIPPIAGVTTSTGLKRIVVHWSAGTYSVSSLDREHYHFIIGGDGAIVPGQHSPEDNINTSDGDYAAHTLNCNTGSIGVAFAAMARATESPFSAGAYPINDVQLAAMVGLCARLCKQYGIPVTPQTVLSHAEVQPTLGIIQRGKWDVAWLPGMTRPADPVTVGDVLRAKIAAAVQ